jgi:hypothetical protein
MRLEALVAAGRAIGVPAVRTMAGERNALRRAAWRGIDDDQTGGRALRHDRGYTARSF